MPRDTRSVQLVFDPIEDCVDCCRVHRAPWPVVATRHPRRPDPSSMFLMWKSFPLVSAGTSRSVRVFVCCPLCVPQITPHTVDTGESDVKFIRCALVYHPASSVTVCLRGAWVRWCVRLMVRLYRTL